MSASIEWGNLPQGQHRMRCPACGKDSRADKTLGVTIDHTGKARRLVVAMRKAVH